MKWRNRRDRYLLPAGRPGGCGHVGGGPGQAGPAGQPAPGGRRRGRFMTGQETLAPTVAEMDALRHQLLQAQRLSSVGELASSVAHEFNNILTTIINYAKMGMKGQTTPAQAQSFEKILRGGQRASAIVNCMLGFARNHSSTREETDVVGLVEEVLLLTDKDLSKHRVQIEKRFHGRPTAVVVPG